MPAANRAKRVNRNLKLSSAAILKLLEQRHSKDVFVSECKDGPTQMTSHLRMDAWVMPRSWAHPATTAYEIKVSRADFLKDQKWQGYLPLCHQFYFVMPPGVASLEEIPAEAGLLVTTRNATRLYMKKKAPLRVVEIPEHVWRYVLMCRTRIVEANYWEVDRVQQWQDWLAERHSDHQLGHLVGQKISRMVGGRTRKVEEDNAQLRSDNQHFEAVRQILEEIGITSAQDWRFRTSLAKLEFARSLEGLRQQTLDEIQIAVQHLTDSGDLLRAAFKRIGATVQKTEESNEDDTQEHGG